MDENDQFQDENVPNDDVYIDDEKNRMNMITSWGFEKYLLFMIMDGTNDYIKLDDRWITRWIEVILENWKTQKNGTW